MSFGPILVVAGFGLALGVVLVFWAMLQNWMADVIHRAEQRFSRLTHTLQSALVTVDRIIVNGQRLILATGHIVFQDRATAQPVTVEEVRRIDPQALPIDVLQKIDAGQPVSYEISGLSKN